MNFFSEENAKVKSLSQKLINYFLRGLLVLLPFAMTAGIIIWILGVFSDLLKVHDLGAKELVFYAIGIVIFILITGYFTRGVVARQIIDFFEGIIEKAPGLKFIFGTTKDMTEAFVGDKKKFTEPVLVSFAPGVDRIGFITRHDMAIIDKPDYMAVYLPASYAISGDLYIVHKDMLTPFNHDSGHLMKFIISGGVASLEKTENASFPKK
jgi:uncharacterized membrane protein